MTLVTENLDTSSSSPALDTCLVGKRARWAFVRTYYYDPKLKYELKRDVSSLLKLEAGWDGSRAQKINPDIIEAAITFINNLSEGVSPKPRVVPTVAGGLQFEWHKGSVSLELEFESPETIHFLQWNPIKKIEREDVFRVSDTNKGEELVKWFASQHA